MSLREPVITRSKLQEMWLLMTRAARFDGEVFRTVKMDVKVTGQGGAIVALSGVSYGVGISLRGMISAGSYSVSGLMVGGLVGMIFAVVTALVWSMTAFLVGTKLFKGSTDYWGLARSLFFSTSPALLFIFVFIPIPLYQTGLQRVTIGEVIGAAVWAWTLVAGVVAVKNTMGFGYDRSMLTFIVGVLILILISGFIRL